MVAALRRCDANRYCCITSSITSYSPPPTSEHSQTPPSKARLRRSCARRDSKPTAKARKHAQGAASWQDGDHHWNRPLPLTSRCRWGCLGIHPDRKSSRSCIGRDSRGSRSGPRRGQSTRRGGGPTAT